MTVDLLALLKRIEWHESDGYPYATLCVAECGNQKVEGHAKDCVIAAAIAILEGRIAGEITLSPIFKTRIISQ